ncbi:MAG: hypothetical protein JSV90_01155 [Methanobacteriota archaeon]|nr:MAG: hypothetical protein JSV90_01155 [Euryarchaeota archaeon]
MKRKGRVPDTVWTAFMETIRFIIVPLVLIDLITENYPQLATAFMSDIRMYIVFFGGMIVTSSTLEAANRPGTYKRMLFGLSAISFVCLWFFVVFGGGIAEFSYGPYFVRFDLSMIVYLVIFGLSLKGLLVISTFKDYREGELERARERRAEFARKMVAATRLPAPPRRRAPAFSTMVSTAFEVSVDDMIGHEPEMPPRPVAKGRKVCEICGAEAAIKDYVCRNCGEWFPSDSAD